MSIQSSLSVASLKSRMILPFWYWLAQVVLEKRPLKGCFVFLRSSLESVAKILDC